MSRYFFHLRDGRPEPDQSGTEFADDGLAAVQAVILAAELARDTPGELLRAGALHVDVQGEDGRPVMSVHVIIERAGPERAERTDVRPLRRDRT